MFCCGKKTFSHGFLGVRVRIEKLMCELDARCKMRRQKEHIKKSYTIRSMLKMYNVG